MLVHELDFTLPEELIAQSPPVERDGARLLVLERATGAITHAHVRDLPDLLAPSLFVVNDTRVIPARLLGAKPTGGKAEIFLLERTHAPDPARERWRALGRASKGLAPGNVVSFGDGALRATVLVAEAGVLEVELVSAGGSVSQAIDALGAVPLPPYIQRAAAAADAERYQTVFAQNAGAVAAPTAGLHFSDRVLSDARARGHAFTSLTLHVGMGTFAPLKVDDLDAHVMHEERFEVPASAARAIATARAEQTPVVAVGTTVVRTLESVARAHDGTVIPSAGRTDIFIRPPFMFRAVDVLFTNFHLPRSTLLALVMAFAGIEPVRRAYAEAVARRYRFFSYGDAMLIR